MIELSINQRLTEICGGFALIGRLTCGGVFSARLILRFQEEAQLPGSPFLFCQQSFS
jgi:hypothetical protein